MGEPRGLNGKVYTWAHSHMGQRVGRGECWDLADQALKHSGAKSSTTTGNNDDYVWGTPIDPHQAMPGDILQLRDHVMVVNSTTSVTFDDGSGCDIPTEDVHRRTHHTAIVVAFKAPESLIVFEQHVKPGGKHVQRHTIALGSSLAPIVETAYRSMKDSKGQMRSAK